MANFKKRITKITNQSGTTNDGQRATNYDQSAADDEKLAAVRVRKMRISAANATQKSGAKRHEPQERRQGQNVKIKGVAKPSETPATNNERRIADHDNRLLTAESWGLPVLY
jgi:hypothetical protein